MPAQRLIPLKVNFDNDPVYIPSDSAYFLKGLETGWQINGGKGQNASMLKPAESNFLYCSVDLPEGENTVVGYYYYSEANESYIICHNSNGYHLIYRLRGIDQTAEIVYRFCRNFKGITNKPKDYFCEGRITIKSICRYTPDGEKELFKALYLVNKKVDNLQIVIEDSIKTNSFTTSFFTSDVCCGDPCRIVKSGVPTPMTRINIIPITATDADKLVQNLLYGQMFQFRLLYENAWGQRSEHGLISDAYSNNIAGCSKDAAGQPHCVWLETKKPCPEIVKVTVEVRSCQLRNGAGTDGNLLSDWKEAFTVKLYDQTNPDLRWHERKYDDSNKNFEIFNDGKSIRMKFCNNGECKPITLADIRNFNHAPINSGTVASLGKGLAYGDNENDLAPMLKEDIESIKLSLSPTEACEMKYSRIKIYAVVHNINENQNNPIHIRGGLATFGGFGQDPAIGNTRFEEKVGDPETTLSAKGGHGQTFPEGINGFRARLAGTNFTAESVQYFWTPSGLEKIGVLSGELDSIKKAVSDNGWGRRYFIQEFDFGFVPSGKYYFRINGHNDTKDLENTSTYYLHTTSINSYNQHWAIPQNYEKEIFIDTTAGNDFMSFGGEAPLAVIADTTNPQNTTSIGSRVMRGYMYEGRNNKIPMELVEVKTNNGMPTGGVTSGFTDHNGFWFTAEWTGGSAFSRLNYKAQLFGANKCTYNTMLGQSGEKSEEGTTLVEPFYVADKIIDYDKSACNRWVVTGKVSECGATTGIEGIAIVLGRTKPVYTNSKGEFKVVAHYSNGRGSDKAIFSFGGSCYVLDCNCQPINVTTVVNQPVCTVCVETKIPIGTFYFKTIVTKGFPHGSRIQIGMIGEDWLGRMTDIQTSEKLFVDFPSEPEQKNATYPKLTITLPDKFSSDICARFKNITFWYSKNVNFEDFFTWAADDVTFIDSTGEKNETNPSKLKIWWRSLNGYNVLRGGNTNTNWSFLNAVMDSKGSQLLIDNQPVFNTRLGDTVEFIQDTDGKYFPPNTIGTVQYDMDGTYFLIDFDESLRDVKAGTKFRIKRPYICEVQKTFYEYPFPINFCNGECTPKDDDGNIVESFVMNAYSSYMLPRQIPVVKDVVSVVETTSGSGVSALKNVIVTPIVNKLFGWNQDRRYTVKEEKTTEVKKIFTPPYAFEHHSPSDTWGDHCHNGGRVSYINPYEGKKCDRNQVLLTGGLNQANDGAINYLHYFNLSDEYAIDEQGWGGITAMLVRDDGQVLLICKFTVFSFRTSDDRAVVDAQGYVRLPIKAIFSAPERNPSFNFGCQADDINTIRRHDTLVFFLDSHKQAAILHNFSEAVDISEGQIKSWLTPSIKEVKSKPDAKYWHSCFDHRLHKIFLTKFDLTTDQYVNNEIENKVLLSETVSFDYIEKQWRQSHFTPEYFGNMYADQSDMQFFSFKNALPYAHHNAVNPSNVYLNYFGVQCEPILGVVTNQGGTDEKLFLSNEVYCRELLFIIERIETSLGQKSRLYESHWAFGAGISAAPYLCDTENIDNCNKVDNRLVDGDSLSGYCMKALYIPEPGYAGQFFLLTAIISYFETNGKNSG